MFTSDLLSQMIRFYGNAMQGMMGKYLESNIKSFTDMQAKLQEQVRSVYGENATVSQDLWAQFLNFQGPAMQSMMGAYMDQSKKMYAQMQEQLDSQTRNLFSGFQFPAFPAGFTPSSIRTRRRPSPTAPPNKKPGRDRRGPCAFYPSGF
jgi:polyhydroxyalkanoate synthesis regulator protein